MSAQKKSRWVRPLLVVILLGCAVVGGGWFYRQYYAIEAPPYLTSVVSRGEMLQIVTASGQLNPVVKVEVGSQISGNIDKLPVDFNSPVKEGDVIAKLDPSSYEAWLIQADGNLASAKAALELAQLNAARAKSLQADKLNAKAEYEKAMAELHQAEATVKFNEGSVKKAQVDLARCTIYAPISGVVISRNVNVGQTVAASLSAPTLFVIANDLSKMQIEANVLEADIGMVEVGQPVDFNVDAFPGQTFHGKVAQVRNAPKTDQNVVTYETIIEVSNAKLKLKPGMTANISIVVARHENALKVANAALRFRPPESATIRKKETTPGAAASLTNEEKKPDKATRKKEKEKRKAERAVYLVSHPTEGKSSIAAAGDQKVVLEPAQIKVGIADSSYCEVLEGLKEGDEVVTGLAVAKKSASQSINPFASNRKGH